MGKEFKLSVSQEAQLGPSLPCGASETVVICSFICLCDKITPSSKGVKAKQWCVSKNLWAYDAAQGFKSTIKAEVPYDMSQNPPAPVMSRNDPRRPTRGRPSGSRIPDVVVVKDGSKPPTQDNIAKVVEIKFPGDDWSEGQEADYNEIAGDDAELEELSPQKCNCPQVEQPQEQEQEQEQKKPATIPLPSAETVATVIAVVAIVGLIALTIAQPETAVATVPAIGKLAGAY